MIQFEISTSSYNKCFHLSLFTPRMLDNTFKVILGYIYIYIYIEREREREGGYIYIYIYISVKQENMSTKCLRFWDIIKYSSIPIYLTYMETQKEHS